MNPQELPKFILSYDRDYACEYIIHTQKPAFIAKVHPKSGQLMLTNELIHKYPIGTRTNRINGIYYLIPVIRFFEEPEDHEQIPKIMSRMGDWYYSLIKEKSENEND
jgi:hypothetical protein